MEYKKDLEIDQHDLDTCCLRQPVLFDIYAQNLTPLYKLRDEIKLEIERFSAKLDGIIRESASAEGKKITENMVQNEIIRNAQYADLQQKFINICAEIKESEVIRDAFSQRKDMLRLLVELYNGQYWATVNPKVIHKQGVESLKDKLEKKIKQDKNNENI